MGIALLTHAQIPTNGLVGYWPFNGNANDESLNGNNGTVNGATLFSDRFGKSNSAYLFDGLDDYISISGSSSLNISNNISICGWYLLKTNTTDALGILDRGPGLDNHGGYYVRFVNKYLQFGISMPYVNNNSQETSVIEKWTFFACTYNNDSVYIYVDNKLTHSSKAGVGNLDKWTDTDPLTIGKEWIHHFNGIIDDIRIYNRALDKSEITSLFNEGICKTSITVTDTLKIDITPTSYNPMTFETTIKVYPNPTKDLLYISCGDYTKVSNYKLKITNSLSQEIWSTTITQNNYSVSMSSFGGTGLYFMEVYDANNNKIDVKKIVLH